MTKLEHAAALRASDKRHYNCAQAVLIPFAQELGLTEEQATAITEHYGSGMRHGGTCGAVSGALAVMGLKGCTTEQVSEFLQNFRRQDNQPLECTALLQQAAAEGVERKDCCQGLIMRAVSLLENI